VNVSILSSYEVFEALMVLLIDLQTLVSGQSKLVYWFPPSK
jgi:hypothetical protein